MERVTEITGGAMADVVLELTPIAAQPITDAIEAVRHSGRIVLAGLKGGKPIEIVTDRLINKGLTVKGAFGVNAEAYIEAIRIIESGRFPLERMSSGHVSSWPTPRPRSRSLGDGTRSTCASARTARAVGAAARERRPSMLVDMHAHVIPGALDAVGTQDGHRGPRIGPCDDAAHARLLETDRG